jgi:hypothetical protein
MPSTALIFSESCACFKADSQLVPKQHSEDSLNHCCSTLNFHLLAKRTFCHEFFNRQIQVSIVLRGIKSRLAFWEAEHRTNFKRVVNVEGLAFPPRGLREPSSFGGR